MTQQALLLGAAALLMLVNTAGVFAVLLQLPGTWLMIVATAAVAWWRWDQQTIGAGVLITLLVLAILGEIIEAVAGSAGAMKGGGGWLSALLSLMGGVVGALAGTVILPIPVLGTLVGACAGAAAGALAAERWRGRSWQLSWQAAKGAAYGRLWGTVGKVVVALVMWLWVLLALIL